MWLLSDAARLPISRLSEKWVSFFTRLCVDRGTRKKQEAACQRLLRLLVDSSPEQVCDNTLPDTSSRIYRADDVSCRLRSSYLTAILRHTLLSS